MVVVVTDPGSSASGSSLKMLCCAPAVGSTLGVLICGWSSPDGRGLSERLSS